jgi:hypothetical protein
VRQSHSDTYAYVNAETDADAEISADTKATSDAAASSIGATRKRLRGNSRENLASSPPTGGSASLKTMSP